MLAIAACEGQAPLAALFMWSVRQRHKLSNAELLAGREEEGWLSEAAGLSPAAPAVQEELYGWVVCLMDWEGWLGGAMAFCCADKSTFWETLTVSLSLIAAFVYLKGACKQDGGQTF